MRQFYIGSLLLFAVLIFTMMVVRQDNHLVAVKRTLHPAQPLTSEASLHFQQDILDYVISFLTFQYEPVNIAHLINLPSLEPIHMFEVRTHNSPLHLPLNKALPEETSAIDLLSGFSVGKTGLTYSFTLPGQSITPTMEFGMDTDDILKRTWMTPKASIEVTIPIR